MTRPTCPHCQRAAVVANSHQCGTVRVRVFGCVRCKVYSLGKQVESAITVGKNMRDRSGRFAIN